MLAQSLSFRKGKQGQSARFLVNDGAADHRAFLVLDKFGQFQGALGESFGIRIFFRHIIPPELMLL